MSDALERLSTLCGIAPEYFDIWGERHPASDATRLALLEAMGVIRDASEVPAALTRLEEAPWLRMLPPVSVQRQPPYAIPVTVPLGDASERYAWTLALENGERLSGEFFPAQLEREGTRPVRGTERLRVRFLWRDGLPLGYHSFTLSAPDGSSAQMRLVIAPEACYLPEILERGARVWGPALQLYALRSQRNWGIGDFTDLRHAVEAAGRSGADIVGISPIHALYPHNPLHASPYSPSSRQYRNVLYLDPEAVPEFAECAGARAAVADPAFQARLQAARAAELVDYSEVAALKLPVLERLFAHFKAHHRRSSRGREFDTYQEAEGEALARFALYHALQEHFHSQDPNLWGWPVWPEEFRHPDSPAVAQFLAAHRARVEFHAWLQWQCHRQLMAVGERSREQGLGVGLYQDLAVSVDRSGAEAWAWQDLYTMNAHVGAPPDDYNLHGQDWGLPPLNPLRLADSGYAPFIALLRANMRHAGALRIDHVMGLMRLFWVPPGGTPEQGAYVHYPFADLLGILALESQRNRCMVVGEDLGTVPDEVRARLAPARVLSYRLLLFERDADGGFKAPEQYPAQALVAATTHDLPTLKGFWQGHDLDLRARLGLFPSQGQREALVVDRAQARARLLMALAREGLLPPGTGVDPVSWPEMTPELAQAIETYLARTPCQVMMVQMEDVFGQLEQVNLPGTTTEYPCWRRKLPLNLEEWESDERFSSLAQALERQGRAPLSHRSS